MKNMKKLNKILVVDDEAIIRESLRDWLSDAGHQVLTAENGHQALKIMRKDIIPLKHPIPLKPLRSGWRS